jgi:uroporphyrinogen-III decarboxylase
MEAVLFAVIERPALVHRLMELITQGMIAYHLEREAAGAVDPEETWGYRVQYEELPAGSDTNRLAYCWPTIAAQSMCGISPAMYEEFVQPYHARLAAVVSEHRVYYHGCENLTAKIPVIRRLPNLRRFHVSAWTDLGAAANRLGREFVLEVCNHPETLAVQSENQMRKDVKKIMEIAGDCIIDINLGEIETVFGNPSVLSTWARVAQEVVAEYA